MCSTVTNNNSSKMEFIRSPASYFFSQPTLGLKPKPGQWQVESAECREIQSESRYAEEWDSPRAILVWAPTPRRAISKPTATTNPKSTPQTDSRHAQSTSWRWRPVVQIIANESGKNNQLSWMPQLPFLLLSLLAVVSRKSKNSLQLLLCFLWMRTSPMSSSQTLSKHSRAQDANSLPATYAGESSVFRVANAIAILAPATLSAQRRPRRIATFVDAINYDTATTNGAKKFLPL